MNHILIDINPFDLIVIGAAAIASVVLAAKFVSRIREAERNAKQQRNQGEDGEEQK